MRRQGGAPEVVPYGDIEGGCDGSGKLTSLQRVPPPILPFQMPPNAGRSSYSTLRHGAAERSGADPEGIRQVWMILLGIWLVGWLFLGYELLWPLYLVWNLIAGVLSMPPFSWLFGWAYRGAPLLSSGAVVQEAQLPPSQVAQYVDSYVQQYGDAALIFATHDGYPQIVKNVLSNEELGYGDLINARDDAGNTALLYAASKGFRQCAAVLIRSGADPDVPNVGGGGRTPLMEAAGGGFSDIVMALRLVPNMTSLDLADDYGNTALHYAAYHGHLSAVLELLKSNPDKDLKNIYGHTPASYAAENKHKAVADVLTRSSARRASMIAKEKEVAPAIKEEQQSKKFEDELEDHVKKASKLDKHVKGVAEELHKKDSAEFVPVAERHMSADEQKALEEQLSKLKRQHGEEELKAQKRIVELMEKSAELQQALEKSNEEGRSLRLNNTEMSFKISELESKHRVSELRVQEEADRARSLREEIKRVQEEADRHRSRADAAAREREHHTESERRHSDNARRLQEEVKQHDDRDARQLSELKDYRERLAKAEADHRQQQDEVDRLQRELRQFHNSDGEVLLASASTSSAAPDQSSVPELAASQPNFAVESAQKPPEAAAAVQSSPQPADSPAAQETLPAEAHLKLET